MSSLPKVTSSVYDFSISEDAEVYTFTAFEQSLITLDTSNKKHGNFTSHKGRREQC